MKAYELITIPAQPERTDLRVAVVNCDLCGRTIKHVFRDGGKQLNYELVATYGDAFEVTVEMKAGETNLDGGSGETTSFDLCPVCFTETLKPWLESQGAEARVEPWHI